MTRCWGIGPPSPDESQMMIGFTVHFCDEATALEFAAQICTWVERDVAVIPLANCQHGFKPGRSKDGTAATLVRYVAPDEGTSDAAAIVH